MQKNEEEEEDGGHKKRRRIFPILPFYLMLLFLCALFKFSKVIVKRMNEWQTMVVRVRMCMRMYRDANVCVMYPNERSNEP